MECHNCDREGVDYLATENGCIWCDFQLAYDVDDFKEYLSDKKILIVGGSPNADCRDEEWYNQFDCIVRINNYKKTNNTKTHIFFSYFGRNIKKTQQELKDDGVEWMINKCPNCNMEELYNNNYITEVEGKDFRWIYDLRKDWWFVPYLGISPLELIEQIKSTDGYMPTSGYSAVLFFLKRIKKPINIIGFDFFESGLHNVDEKWDNSGGHRPDIEKTKMLDLIKKEKLIWNN